MLGLRGLAVSAWRPRARPALLSSATRGVGRMSRAGQRVGGVRDACSLCVAGGRRADAFLEDDDIQKMKEAPIGTEV